MSRAKRFRSWGHGFKIKKCSPILKMPNREEAEEKQWILIIIMYFKNHMSETFAEGKVNIYCYPSGSVWKLKKL